MSREAVRVLVADDYPALREGLQVLLGSAPGIEVAGQAATGAEAVRLAKELQPDVVMMDLHMPDLSGIEATRRIVQATPHIRVLVLTTLEDDDSVFAAIRAGAYGYLLKGAGRDELVRAVTAVSEGELIMGPGIAQRARTFSPQVKHPRPPRHSPSSATGNDRSLTCWPGATATLRSRSGCSSAPRRRATTSRTSSPSCTSQTLRRPSCAPARLGSEESRPAPSHRETVQRRCDDFRMIMDLRSCCRGLWAEQVSASHRSWSSVLTAPARPGLGDGAEGDVVARPLRPLRGYA
jgi:DNA-binding NarL/FixJ family response regulator